MRGRAKRVMAGHDELPLISVDRKKVIPYNPGYCGHEEIKIAWIDGKLSLKIDESTAKRTHYFTRKRME